MNQLKTKKLLKLIRYKPNQQLVLLRGLPGSGKSTLANQIVKTNAKFCHFEADQYFYSADNQYQFNPEYLIEAHRQCFNKTKTALIEGKSVVVANTFVRRWELERYFRLSKKLNVRCTVFVCDGQWKSVHNIPHDVLQRMQQQWQVII